MIKKIIILFLVILCINGCAKQLPMNKDDLRSPHLTNVKENHLIYKTDTDDEVKYLSKWLDPFYDIYLFHLKIEGDLYTKLDIWIDVYYDNQWTTVAEMFQTIDLMEVEADILVQLNKLYKEAISCSVRYQDINFRSSGSQISESVICNMIGQQYFVNIPLVKETEIKVNDDIVLMSYIYENTELNSKQKRALQDSSLTNDEILEIVPKNKGVIVWRCRFS